MVLFTREQLADILQVRVMQPGCRKKYRGVTIDSRIVKKGHLFIAIQGARLDGHDFIQEAVKKGATGVIVSQKIRGIPSGVLMIRVPDTTLALGRLAHAHRMRFKIPVIAVTGSAGKTTTKELIAAALAGRCRVLRNKGSYNNFWGVPLTLLRMSARYDAAVVELGTNHPGEIASLSDMVRPTVAVLTNVGPAHLQGFQSVKKVYQEKRSVMSGLTSGGAVVFNADDPFLSALKSLRRKTMCYGMEKKADMMARDVQLETRGEISFRVNGRHTVSLKTPVRENVMNALAAVCCGRLMGVPFSEISQGLGNVRFQQKRQQVERVKGVTMIDDSYNANPLSFRSALHTLTSIPVRGRRILVCGDMLELGPRERTLHQELGREASVMPIDMVFAFGPLMAEFAREIQKGNGARRISCYDDMKRLNHALIKQIAPGDAVLIKGSHGMCLERAVSFLKKRLA